MINDRETRLARVHEVAKANAQAMSDGELGQHVQNLKRTPISMNASIPASAARTAYFSEWDRRRKMQS